MRARRVAAMSDPSFKEALVGFVRDNLALAEPIVMLMGFAEGIPGLSLLVPSTPLFLAIGAAHAAAGGQFVYPWLAAAFGAVASDCLIYALGRFFKNDAQRIWPLSRNPDWLAKGQALFARWGLLAVVGGKFAGLARPFIPAVAGISEMPLWQFLPASIVSSLAWAGAFLGPGYGIKWLAF